ncbi:MAG: DUF6119 family protein [Desulfovibrio sp.]
MARSRQFSIYLLKQGFDDTNSLKDEHKLKEPEGAVTNLPDGATLFIGDKPPSDPWWKDYWGIQQPLQQTLKDAVLFIPTDDRCFALTFGHSYHNLKETCYEYDFGLRTTLNALDPQKIKSTDSLVPENAKRERKQMPIASELTLFDINSDESIIKKLTGAVQDKYKGFLTNITGASSLKVTSKLSALKIKGLCEELLKIYLKDDFKSTFPDIQNIVPVKDPDIILQLNASLLESFSSHQPEIVLTTPEIINYDYSHKFSYCNGRNCSAQYDDIHIEHYWSYLDSNELTISSVDALKAHKLKIQNENGHTLHSFSIFKCLLFDCENGENHYHFCEGEWYRIDKDYIEKLERVLNELFISDDVLRECNFKREDDFNCNVSEKNDRYICLDKKNISPSGQTQVEPCDLFTLQDSSALLIHIKIGTRSSSLSHLFNQGVNSVELLRESEEAQQKLKDLVAKDCHSAIDSGNYSILFGIITSKNSSEGAKNLPIFSRISLMRTANALKRMNINTSVAFIKDNVART